MTVFSRPSAHVRWDDVPVFLGAYRLRNLGQAARRLGLDTSTMSRRLTQLEESLGARLFERGRQGLVPTQVAEQILPAAETMESAHRQLTRDASDVETEAEGVVRISAAPGVADAFVAPSLARLRELHPAISIELDVSTRVLDLTRYEADLALRFKPSRGAELLATKVATARWVAAAAPALKQELEPVRAWSELPWITWDRDLSSLESSSWLQKHAAQAEVALRTSSFHVQLSAAERGVGAVLVPEPYLELWDLQPLEFSSELVSSTKSWPVDELWLVGHRALRDVPRVAAVWSFLVRLFRGE